MNVSVWSLFLPLNLPLNGIFSLRRGAEFDPAGDAVVQTVANGDFFRAGKKGKERGRP
jgi:hypothetical protein